MRKLARSSQLYGNFCLGFFVARNDCQDIGGKTYKVREETTAIKKTGHSI